MWDEWEPPKDPFAHRGSLYWFELAPLLRRNAAPWQVIKVNYYPNQFKRMVTIMNWRLPEMALRTGTWRPDKGETFGQHFVEEEAHAVVCNMAWIDGECPFMNIKGWWTLDDRGEPLVMKQRPERGVLEAVRMMVDQGTLEPTREVGFLLHDYEMVGRARR